MHISTVRFGSVPIEAEDILLFPQGLIGYEDCRHWVLLADADSDAVAWLQSVSRPDLAVPLVSPRRFVPNYRVRISRRQLSRVKLSQLDKAYVLAAVSRNEGRLTVNLRAPLIINLDQRIGCQVVTTDEQPLQLPLADAPRTLRRSA